MLEDQSSIRSLDMYRTIELFLRAATLILNAHFALLIRYSTLRAASARVLFIKYRFFSSKIFCAHDSLNLST